MKRSFQLVEAAEASKKHAGASLFQPDDAQPRLVVDPRDIDSSLDETKLSKTLRQSISRVFDQPDQGENEAEVCYGSLLDLPVQVREDPLLYKGSAILHRNNDVIHISTSFVGSYCWINFRDIARFGCLSQKTSQALKSITALPSVKIEGITSWSSIEKASAEWNKSGNLATLRIDMNVYGSSAATVGKSAGRFLSNARLFLQSPSSVTRSVAYDNPQYLRLPNVSSMHIIDKPTQHLAEQVSDSAKGVSHLELESILNSIPQPKVLKEVPITWQIRTALKSYQREGVDFLTSRETGDLPPSLSLWKPHSPPGGPFCYKHVITGAKSSEMNDVLGGILADEMGLGKTLTVLAVIAGSRGRALDYAVRRTSGTTNSWKDVAPCKTTLVIVPSSLLLDSWEEEIAKHLEPGTLATHRYHGSGKCVDITHLLRMDVVLTTYATVAADFFRGKSTLNRIEWYRLVLDEAHYIRNSSCKQFRVIQSIPARIRWCLTGTPIQNSLEDLGALLKFLRIPVLEDSASFRNHICTPILSTKTSNRFSNLVRLLEAICLRRTKALLKQPEPLVEINRLHFTTEEHNQYSDYALNCKHDIDMAVSGHSFKKANQHVIQAILGLRLFCNDGERFLSKRTSPNGLPSLPEDALSVLQTSSNAFCIQCGCEITTMYQRDDKSSGVLTICQHLVCGECLPIFEADLNDKTEDGRSCCPSCGRTAERTSFIIMPSSDEEQSTDTQPMISWPTKLHAVLKNVQSQNPKDKCVIFSFWKTTLDIMAKMFDANSLPYLRIHGSIPANQRARTLSDFENSPSTRVLLITLGTGAVGLNKMKSANIVHIIEPQWNPSVENQAIGRIVRLGQEKAVKIFRYIMQGSVEEAVQSRQLRKLQLARGGFGLSKDDHGEKRISEIMSLICPSFLGK